MLSGLITPSTYRYLLLGWITLNVASVALERSNNDP